MTCWRELDRMEFYVYETRQTVKHGIAAGSHHVQQREGTSGRVPAPLLLSLHQVSGQGHDAGDHRCPLPKLRKELLHNALAVFFGVRELRG